jgi:hypothetical protein
MPLVLAVLVESSRVTELLTTTHIARDHVVDLNVIFLPEIQATPPAFSFGIFLVVSEAVFRVWSLLMGDPLSVWPSKGDSRQTGLLGPLPLCGVVWELLCASGESVA